MSVHEALGVKPKTLQFDFLNLRKISLPDDEKIGRKIYVGQSLAEAFLDLPDGANVRGYLVKAEGKQRMTPSAVHREIRATLENNPEDFPILNSGIVIVAKRVDVDDSKACATLTDASIINGSQTQGELREYFRRCRESEIQPERIRVKFEIVETSSSDLMAEISIARNFQNDVAQLSIVGRRRQLDDLEAAMDRDLPGTKLKKSETDRADRFTDTEKLLQVITALIPSELWPKSNESGSPNKVYTYSMKSKCLREFEQLYEAAHMTEEQKSKLKPQQEKERSAREQLYNFYLEIAPSAWKLYNKWKKHQGFAGTGLRCLGRDGNTITDVPDGLVFPILSALSAFVVRREAGWQFAPPTQFQDEDLIRSAKRVYIEIGKSNPWNMGKSAPAYLALWELTALYKRLLHHS